LGAMFYKNNFSALRSPVRRFFGNHGTSLPTGRNAITSPS
jgi:hypothetical protein